jgi:hypothetical protein
MMLVALPFIKALLMFRTCQELRSLTASKHEWLLRNNV